MSAVNLARILYMEDDRALARLVKHRLERAGYAVDLACDGNEGLLRYAAGAYEVLVVDHAMPVRDGLDVIRTLAAEGPLPPTIMVTGAGNERIAVEVMKLGITDYIIKDMEGGYIDLLAIVIGRALEKQRLVQEKQQAEESLRLTQFSVDRCADAVFWATPEGRLLYVNDAACRLLNVSREELLSTDVQHIAPDFSKEAFAQTWQDLRSRGFFRWETYVRTKDGAAIPVDISANYVQFQGREYGCAFVRDITERRRMEDELAHAQKMESIGQLAAGIAHEINTPTQYIGDNVRFLQDAFGDIQRLLRAFDQLLRAAQEHAVGAELIAEIESLIQQADVPYLASEIPKAIQQSLEGVERVATIVRAMKEFSHPGRGQKQAIDLNHAIDTTLTVSRNEWKYLADVVTDFDPSLPLVPCLPGEFHQVILNLVVNAAQAIANVAGDGPQRKGTITVRTRRDGDWAEIRIADTGTGIPAEISAKVFDPFFTTKEVGKGTGQGLSIAHFIMVEKHHGTITFETTVGRGTTFIIRLPIGERSLAEDESQAEEPEAILP